MISVDSIPGLDATLTFFSKLFVYHTSKHP